jgi:CRP/FNR family cyclic AMP-dependent transcriptional regulator
MSLLLERPHTASVRAVTLAKVHVIEQATEFLNANPHIALPIARLLADACRTPPPTWSI